MNTPVGDNRILPRLATILDIPFADRAAVFRSGTPLFLHFGPRDFIKGFDIAHIDAVGSLNDEVRLVVLALLEPIDVELPWCRA